MAYVGSFEHFVYFLGVVIVMGGQCRGLLTSHFRKEAVNVGGGERWDGARRTILYPLDSRRLINTKNGSPNDFMESLDHP